MPKSKSKANATVARLPRRQQKQLGTSDAVVRFYTGQSDAFRYPDMETAATALMSLPEEQTITMNAAGSFACAFAAPIVFSYQVNTITAGNLAATWTATGAPLVNTCINNTKRARQTGHRVTVRYIGTELDCQGLMYVGTSPSFGQTMISTSTATYQPLMRSYALKAGGEWTFYIPMIDDPNWEDPSSGSWQLNYWNSLVFLFQGCKASSAVISIKSVRSIEYIPEMSSAVLCTTMPEPYDPVGMAEAGILNGSAQDQGNDDGPGWAEKVGGAVYRLVRGTAVGAVNAAREDVRAHMMDNNHRIMEF